MKRFWGMLVSILGMTSNENRQTMSKNHMKFSNVNEFRYCISVYKLLQKRIIRVSVPFYRHVVHKEFTETHQSFAYTYYIYTRYTKRNANNDSMYERSRKKKFRTHKMCLGRKPFSLIAALKQLTYRWQMMLEGNSFEKKNIVISRIKNKSQRQFPLILCH